MKNRDAVRAAYDGIGVSPALPGTVTAALRPRRKRFGALRASLSAAACLLLACVALLNLSPTAAQAAFELPVLGGICRVFTFRHYDFEDAVKTVEVSEPNLSGTGDTALEKRVNAEIAAKIDAEVQEGKARADEYYQAYLDTGGDPAAYQPLEIVVNYELKYASEDAVSFLIYKYETLASAYAESTYYNLDLKTGRSLTLEDLLGADWRAAAAAGVEAGIRALPADKASLLFADTDIGSLIDENRPFYLSPDGTGVVIVFDKYEIAAGAAGSLEFTVPIPGK